MKLLIIGSKGFIGSRAARYFRESGQTVYECDVVVEYNDPYYFQVDASNADYSEIFESVQFDACINCSGAASVPDSLVHPYRDFHLNVHNVFTLLECIRKHNKECKFINLSSAAVYGNPVQLPIGETASIKPISPYGQHKHYAEMICEEFHTYFNLSTCSIRIFSAYGPGLKKQLFWDLYKKSLASDRIELFGSGKESRDFIFIEDVVLGIETILLKGSFEGTCYNLASGVQTTIQEATSCFFNILNPKIAYAFQMNNREGDPLNWQADIKAIQALGFTPRHSLQAGITKYIQWLRETV